ncbi:MAG: lipid IV(A) 3-deoxy-D-manno-octulosonic acid transferase [Legionellaceae bacterium]|nr:lipid IV(A) 3-deoxy-D-manno-octulosonic acid transferase [Legionellaceae bacterium]
MRRVYTFFMYVFVPLIVLRLFIRSKTNPAYRERISERFELASRARISVDVWVHAVSLGEVVAATPLIEELLKDNKKVLVTTMTPSGSKQVIAKFKDKVSHQYVPYDLPWCLKRFFKKIDTPVGIIMETEIWPNLIHFAKLSGVKLGLVNARISDKAFIQYLKTKKFFKPILNNFTFIGAQSEIDSERYMELGARPEIVSVVGNIKFDLPHPGDNLKDFSELQNAWGRNRPILIAASTHDDEEQQLLERLKKLQEAIPDIILLIAPRHVERFKAVYELSKKLGFKTGLRSQHEKITQEEDVIVLDCIGELLGFFKLSDYAFVGGSLVPIGGHNVLEPIVMGVPVFCGPYMHNSKSICQELKSQNAIEWRGDADDLVESIIAMFASPQDRDAQVANAEKVLKSNKGSLGKYLEKIAGIA